MAEYILKPKPQIQKGDKLSYADIHDEDRTIEIIESIPNDVWNSIPEHARKTFKNIKRSVLPSGT